jgi:hypothetical protein
MSIFTKTSTICHQRREITSADPLRAPAAEFVPFTGGFC